MASKLPYTKSEAKAWGKATLRDWYDCPCTPFLKDNTLDEAGLRSNVEQLIAMGESGQTAGTASPRGRTRITRILLFWFDPRAYSRLSAMTRSSGS